MNLLFLTVIPSPYQRQLFQALDASGAVDLTVFYFTAGAHDREWKRPDLHPFEAILDGRTITRLGPSAHWNPSIMAEIDRLQPDLTVISDYSALTAQFAMRKLAARRQKWMFWGEVPGFSKRGALGSFLRRQLQAPIGRADGIAGIGSVAVEAYERLFPGKPVFNIPYFCDLEPFRAARETTSEKETIDILFSGQMIERKGLPVLLDAFERIARKHPRLRLLTLGGGPEKAAYQAMVPTDLCDRVIFHGHKDPKDLPEVFANADIFCLPSRHDGWGVVVNEALGAGLPILVSDATGAGPDLVDQGGNGFITPVGDAEALARALDQVAGDCALRAGMAQASAEKAAQWGTDEGARRWVAAAQAMLR